MITNFNKIKNTHLIDVIFSFKAVNLHAFEIDERTFQELDIGDDDGQETKQKMIMFDQDLFGAEDQEELPDSSEDEDDEDDDTGHVGEIQNGSEGTSRFPDSPDLTGRSKNLTKS